jgi:hypothetical protein
MKTDEDFVTKGFTAKTVPWFVKVHLYERIQAEQDLKKKEFKQQEKFFRKQAKKKILKERENEELEAMEA